MDLAYETERLIVRNWRAGDADRVFDIYSRMGLTSVLRRTCSAWLFSTADTYCALLTGSSALSALILTTHPETSDGPFTGFRGGLDHVSFAAPDLPSLDLWQARLIELAVPADRRRSEWGHHLKFRDPDNIAVEIVVLEPEDHVTEILR